VNSAASLAAGLPVGRHAVRLGVLAAYSVPAMAAWALLGLGLGTAGAELPGLRGVALAAVAGYASYYGALELSGRRGLPPPGRGWQVPQTMLIEASARRRLLVWGALLGPGFATRNPFAGFGLMPLAVASMPGPAPAVVLGAAVGLAHGAARAAALLRDVRELGPAPESVALAGAIAGAVAAAGAGAIAGAGAGGAATEIVPGEVLSAEVLPTHLGMVLKTIYWRRFEGAVLLAAAATGVAACLRYIT
jgi:hypothetical protein